VELSEVLGKGSGSIDAFGLAISLRMEIDSFASDFLTAIQWKCFDVSLQQSLLVLSLSRSCHSFELNLATSEVTTVTFLRYMS
jgi:hypothetical protein